MRIFLVVFVLLLTVPLNAQSVFHGKFVYFEYDAGLSNIGIITQKNSRNASFKVDLKIWDIEIEEIPNSGIYIRKFINGNKTAYYPTDGTHYWLDGIVTITEMFTGEFECTGYDGNLALQGDLKPGNNNGILFRRPVRNAHILKEAGLWHLEINIWDGNGFNWYWAVFPISYCSLILV